MKLKQKGELYIAKDMVNYLLELNDEEAGQTIKLMLLHHADTDAPLIETPIIKENIDDLITGAKALYCVNYENVCLEYGFQYTDYNLAISQYVNGLVTMSMWRIPQDEPQEGENEQQQE